MRLPSLFLFVSLVLALGCRSDATGSAVSGARSATSATTVTTATCAPPIPPEEGVRGSFIGGRFGPLSLYERTATGAEAPLSTDELRRPCDPRAPRLLVVRLDAPWCAPCTVSADGYAAALASFGDQVVALDVLFSGADNALTQPADLAVWYAAHPSMPGHVARAADGSAAEMLRYQHVSPAVFLVELRSMHILDVAGSPTSDKLMSRIGRALSSLGGTVAAAAAAPAPLLDARFTPDDWAVLRGMRVGVPPPPDPTNAHADDPAAAELGKALFFDASLGAPHALSCASCHSPSRAFSDGLATGHGAGASEVNTLGLGPAAYNRWWFWDGRADSLWAQATSPLENPREMGGTRLAVAHGVLGRHRAPYERVFGALPPLAEGERFPPAGKPGDPSFDRMSKDDQRAVTRVFVNAAKAIAAFERTLRPVRSRFDAYLAGDVHALTPRERDGAKVFLDGGCAVCHNGPMLTDDAFHDIHMPSSSLTAPGLRGRVDGVLSLIASEFRGDGPYSDAPAASRLATLAPAEIMLAQIKTPSLRDLSLTAPYGHGGNFKTLEAAVAHYDMEELTDTGPTRIGALDPAVVAFAPSDAHRAAVLAFLRAVGGGERPAK
ncbi:MAG TPA: cytochrome c peroxidase [Polyangiaceae bacterium]|nr:cytochrome c peroxidase [Polyangiaceae bacterium]